MSNCIKAVINALVPFMTANERFAPTVSAHLASNSLTTAARDHTPLRITSSSCFSSVSGFQMGQVGQLWVRTGLPPSNAGGSANENEVVAEGLVV